MWWYNYLILFFSLSTVVFAVDNICGIQNVTCNPNDKYRSVDGTCNNLDNPNWGTIGSVYARMLPAKYSDGVHAFALTSSQKPLPNALELTENIYTQGYVETCENVMLGAMTMLQLVAHDLSYTNLTNKACCTENLRNLKPVPERCENIRVSKNDPYYSRINATCLPFERTATNFQAGCQLSQKSADPVNGANNWLDLSVIHGHTYAVNAERRAYINGTLKVQVNNNHEYPPNADRSRCPGLLPFENTCYFTGDGRVNQNPQLTISHTLWIREHNRVARGLAELNSHWNDEKLYQEARLITISEYQHIVFYELLPYFLGREGLIKNKIIYEQPTSRYPMFPIYSNQFIDDYNKTQPPHIYNEFSHGAFRQFHSVIAGKLGLFDNKGCPYDALALRDYIDRPVELETADIFDSLIRGLMHQPQMPSDRYYDPEFTRYMFMKTTRFGTSTRAVDVQRARDHGVPSYNYMRELCGLPKVKNFSGFSDVMPQEHIDILERYYEIPDDVELVVGGSLETNVEGTKAGPTSLCIMYKQFHNVRTADRFFFEGKGTGFTSTQLQEIRKSSMAGIFCRNGNNIKDVQRKAFEQPSVSNPPVCCKYIPSPDLTAWKESV